MIERDTRPGATSRAMPAEGLAPQQEVAIKSAIVFLAALAVYILLRSPGLDEFDSVNFALGLREFNLWEHQPHPPGYPLFIFAGWLAQNLFRISPEISLHHVSALGGAGFVLAWFLIIRLQISERLAWWVAVCLVVTPAVWMTATKVLSDAFASSLLSLEIFWAVYFANRRNLSALLWLCFIGAAATGARPQFILVAIVILITSLKQAGASLGTFAVAGGTFIGACLLWLLPTCYLQARLRPEIPGWLAYPKLLFGQWKWRLNNPYAFLGAGGWTPHYLATRFADHILGWLGLGFGFIQSWATLAIGAAILITGVASYIVMRGPREDASFWKFHLPWALLHIAIIFSFLGGKQRYYLVIFPLLLVVLIRGLLQLPKPWHALTLLLPLLFVYITVPAALQNHREEAPPIRLVRYLHQLYPTGSRGNVALLFINARRQAEWYGSDFKTFQKIPDASELPRLLKNFNAVYTDDSKVRLPAGWRRIPLAVFQRSVIIHTKHHFVMLYLVVRDL